MWAFSSGSRSREADDLIYEGLGDDITTYSAAVMAAKMTD
jgi:hypothetical protein